jgi:hypothetical protein
VGRFPDEGHAVLREPKAVRFRFVEEHRDAFPAARQEDGAVRAICGSDGGMTFQPRFDLKGSGSAQEAGRNRPGS